jgi:flagellar basal body-associated protein FliL
MKKSIMIWAVSAIVYLGIVIAGYSVYASINPKSEEHNNHTTTEQGEESLNHQHSHQDHENHGANTNSEVTPKVSYANGAITIELIDNSNDAPELEVSHEKYMHLIVVSSDLKEYHHLHPEKKGEGTYQVKVHLEDNSFKAFVDINPKGLQYAVRPIELQVGETHHVNGGNELVPDTDFTKTINGEAVELTTRSFEVNKEVTLNFDVKGGKPEKYLGALGHVVILDEDGGKFIHVHPASDDKTVFETQFDKPGIYKLWAEFKFHGQVNAYPFVIEVK